MILGHYELHRLISGKIWTFESLYGKEPSIGPNSIDVSLAPKAYIMKPSKSSLIIPEQSDPSEIYEELDLTSGVTVQPGDFILASVAERVDCSAPIVYYDREDNSEDSPLKFTSEQYVQHYDGRSTMARIGIQSHVSAGFGDYGFNGAFTLEIVNVGSRPVLLTAGLRIGQIYFEQVKDPKSYKGYDQTNFEPQLPRLGKGRF